MMKSALLGLMMIAHLMVGIAPASAHHILGRPSYSLNEDSNTPPSIQMELLMDHYLVTGMIYPAFPQPDEPGRISVYISDTDDQAPFDGVVVFKVRDDPWYAWSGIGVAEETIGTQKLDDSVFRQAFMFRETGDYLILAEFEDGETNYTVEMPIRVGPPAGIGPIGVIVALLAVALIGINLVQRRRALSGKIRSAHAAPRGDE